MTEQEENEKEIKLAEFFNDRYVWIRSQDGGETLILREYWKGEKRRCKTERVLEYGTGTTPEQAKESLKNKLISPLISNK